MTTTTPTASTDRRSERHQARRNAILVEAWDLARRDGLAGISLRDLADRVGLRQPSLYSYFESKLDLYDAMFEQGNRQLVERVADHRFDPDPRRALVELLALSVTFSSQDIVRHQLLFQRTIPGFEPSPAAYAPATEFYEVAVGLLADAGVTEAAEIDLFSALASGLGHQQVANDPGGDRWARLAGMAVERFLATASTSPTPTKESRT